MSLSQDHRKLHSPKEQDILSFDFGMPGLVFGYIKKLGLIDYINSLVPPTIKLSPLSHGEVIALLVMKMVCTKSKGELTSLDEFVRQVPLPYFYARRDLLPDDINEDVVCATLDAISSNSATLVVNKVLQYMWDKSGLTGCFHKAYINAVALPVSRPAMLTFHDEEFDSYNVTQALKNNPHALAMDLEPCEEKIVSHRERNPYFPKFNLLQLTTGSLEIGQALPIACHAYSGKVKDSTMLRNFFKLFLKDIVSKFYLKLVIGDDSVVDFNAQKEIQGENCHTLTRVTNQQVLDYSWQIVVKDSNFQKIKLNGRKLRIYDVGLYTFTNDNDNSSYEARLIGIVPDIPDEDALKAAYKMAQHEKETFNAIFTKVNKDAFLNKNDAMESYREISSKLVFHRSSATYLQRKKRIPSDKLYIKPKFVTCDYYIVKLRLNQRAINRESSRRTFYLLAFTDIHNELGMSLPEAVLAYHDQHDLMSFWKTGTLRGSAVDAFYIQNRHRIRSLFFIKELSNFIIKLMLKDVVSFKEQRDKLACVLKVLSKPPQQETERMDLALFCNEFDVHKVKLNIAKANNKIKHFNIGRHLDDYALLNFMGDEVSSLFNINELKQWSKTLVEFSKIKQTYLK